MSDRDETVNHPLYYGGDTVYEAIKVIDAWGLSFRLGNALKYVCRAGRKGDAVEDLRKAAWYIDSEIKRLEKDKTMPTTDREGVDDAEGR
jgi:hypothetical protein